MDHDGKVVESNPENGGNQQSLSRKSSKEIDSNSIREVDELVGTWIGLTYFIIIERLMD